MKEKEFIRRYVGRKLKVRFRLRVTEHVVSVYCTNNVVLRTHERQIAKDIKTYFDKGFLAFYSEKAWDEHIGYL
jgi:hypothetical protein